MANLYQIKDIIKENKNGDFLAICESGNHYECKFVAEYRTMFFTIPSTEKILGYGKIIAKNQPKAPDLELPPWDGLPVLMMADQKGKSMIIGTCMNGKKCVYDLPIKIETVEQFESLIYGYNNGRLSESQREELYNQPKLLGLNGPMYNGTKILKSTGEEVAVIRYERP